MNSKQPHSDTAALPPPPSPPLVGPLVRCTLHNGQGFAGTRAEESANQSASQPRFT